MSIFPVLNRAEIHEKYSKMVSCEVYREVCMIQPLYFYLFLPRFSMKEILLLSTVGTFANSVFPSQGAMFYSLPLIKIWQQVRKRGLQFFYIIVHVQILQNGEWARGNCIKILIVLRLYFLFLTGKEELDCGSGRGEKYRWTVIAI